MVSDGCLCAPCRLALHCITPHCPLCCGLESAPGWSTKKRYGECHGNRRGSLLFRPRSDPCSGQWDHRSRTIDPTHLLPSSCWGACCLLWTMVRLSGRCVTLALGEATQNESKSKSALVPSDQKPLCFLANLGKEMVVEWNSAMRHRTLQAQMYTMNSGVGVWGLVWMSEPSITVWRVVNRCRAMLRGGCTVCLSLSLSLSFSLSPFSH